MLTGNTHFTIALHVLTSLAHNVGEPVTSTMLATSVDTNPAFLRAVIGTLRDAGFVQTRLGAGGGALLGRPAHEIRLLDVYRAIEGQANLRSHDCSDSDCFIAAGMTGVMARLGSRLDEVLAAELATITIADLYAEVTEQRPAASLS